MVRWGIKIAQTEYVDQKQTPILAEIRFFFRWAILNDFY